MPRARSRWPPPAGKWSAREIVAHLADCEMVFAFRLRQTLAGGPPDHAAVRPGGVGGAVCGL